jgi:hypothetical protein
MTRPTLELVEVDFGPYPMINLVGTRFLARAYVRVGGGSVAGAGCFAVLREVLVEVRLSDGAIVSVATLEAGLSCKPAPPPPELASIRCSDLAARAREWLRDNPQEPE